MSTPIILALAAMAFMGAADAVSRRARQMGAPSSSYLLAQAPFFILTASAALARYGRPDFSSTAIAWAALAGVLAFAATACLIQSLKHGLATVNVAVFRLNFVLSSMLAMWLFREAPRWNKLAGLALAVAAIAFFFRGMGGRGSHQRQALAYAIAGMFLAAGLQLVWAKAGKLGIDRGSFLLIQSLVFLCPAALYAWIDQRLRITLPTLKYAAANGALLAFGTLAVLESVVRGEASVCIPITQLSFVVTTILAAAFLHERITWTRGAGCALAIGAIILLALPAPA